MKFNEKVFVVFIAVTSIALLLPTIFYCLAGIVVSPSSMNESLEKGKASTKNLSITNTGTGSITFDIEVVPSGNMNNLNSTRPPNNVSAVFEPKGSNAASGTGVPVISNSGGTDGFGYRWIDSNEPGGPEFNYIDISSTGTEISGLADDSFKGPFPIGFTFSFYGNNYTQFYLSSNGFIGFGPTTDYDKWLNDGIPNSMSPNNIMCLLWDDLCPLSDSHVYYKTVNNKLIIQFVNYGEYSGWGTMNAEIILYPDGDIKFQYDSFIGGFDTAGCTVGIENSDGSDGLQIVLNADYLEDNLAVLISPFWLNVDPAYGTIMANGSVDIDVSFNAIGSNIGTHYANIVVRNYNNIPNVVVPVSMTVFAHPDIRVDPISLTFTKKAGATSFMERTLGKVNFDPKSQYIKNEILVKFKPGAMKGNITIVDGIVKTPRDSVNKIFKQLQVVSMKKVFLSTKTPLGDIYHLKYNGPQFLQDALSMMANDGSVEWVEPNYLAFTSRVPNDYNPNMQWGLAKILAAQAWDISIGSPNIVIAIVDTGVDYNHADLTANIWHNTDEIPGNNLDDDNNGFIDDDIGWDFVSETSGGAPGEDMGPRDRDPMDFHGHGTHCSGIASAVTNNGLGIAGTAWSCKIMAVRAGFKTAYGGGALLYVDSAAAIEYAANNGAHVISMSWGGDYPSNVIISAIQYAYSRGCVLVASAGNDGDDLPNYPAGYNEVIAVAASTSNDGRASFSNYGDWVDIAAPGVYIYSTLPNNSYALLSGTSMAAPFVAGVSALLLANDPTTSQEEIRQILVDSGDNINWGVNPTKRLNAFKALTRGRSFAIYNDGSADLNVTNISIENGSSWISTDFGGPFTIPPGRHKVVILSLNISGMLGGIYTDRIKIESDDPDENPTFINITLNIQNSPPQIISITANPNPVNENSTSTIKAVVIDDDGHNLTYNWSVTQGNITGSGPVVTFNPPDVSQPTFVIITLTVDDSYGGTDTETEVIGINPVTISKTINLAIKTGWNLISCPGDPIITSFAQLLKGTIVLPYALTWDANAGKYVTTDIFEFNKAYWWAATANGNISVEYIPRNSYTKQVKMGWNMIGSVDGAVPVSSVTSIPPNSVLPYALKWNPTTGKYDSSSTLDPGFGYWVAATRDATLNVSYPPPSSSSQAVAEIPEWIGVITVSNNSGPQQEVAFGIHKDALDEVDMMDILIPPSASETAFEAYFVGDAIFGKIGRDIKHKSSVITWTLKIKSAKSAARLFWDIGNIPSNIGLILSNSDGKKTDMRKTNVLTLSKGEHTLILEAAIISIRDVTSMVKVDRKDITYDVPSNQLSIKMSITNVSNSNIYEPLHLVIANLTPGVSVVNASGITASGLPYMDYTGKTGDGRLDPGESSKEMVVIFRNPGGIKYSFDLRCEGNVLDDILATPSPDYLDKHYEELHVVVPSKSQLMQNYPNPFNPETWIPYELALPSEVKVSIYDVQGRLVRVLDIGYRDMGEFFSRDRAIYWDGRNDIGEEVQSGVYFYELSAGEYRSVKKMVIIK